MGTITGSSTDTPLAIPDGDLAGVSSVINIAQGAPVAGILVEFSVTHTYIGDLTFYLSDDVDEITIGQGPGRDYSNGTTSYYSLSTNYFDGRSTQQAWALRVRDDAAQDTGTLDSWTITLTTPDDYGMAVLPVLADGAGKETTLGAGAPTLSLLVSGVGLHPGKGAAYVPITPDGQGGVEINGDGSALLPVTASGRGAVDWVSQLDTAQLREVYRLIITGDKDAVDDLVLGGISSWQATNQAGNRSSYLQAVIPAAGELLSSIEARQQGDLVIQKGLVLADGTERYEEILRSNFDDFRYDQGPSSLTATVSGYLSGKVPAKSARTLEGIRTISMSGGKFRVRCAIDMFLQPGMTVSAGGNSFTADYINYYVSDNEKFCEVSER